MWREPSPTSRRALDQIEFTDIGIAFDVAQAKAMGAVFDSTSIPAIYRGFQLLTDLVASLPMRQLSGSTYTAETPPVLLAPNPGETYTTTLRQVMASLLFRGNAYLWPRARDDQGRIRSVYVLNPDEVTITPSADGLYPRYEWRGQAMTDFLLPPEEAAARTRIPKNEIVHIPLNRWPGRFAGVSPLTAARLMLSGIHAENALARHLATDDATPSGLLEVPQKLSKDEAEAVQDHWEKAHGGTSRRPAVLSGGVKFQPLTFTPADAQFLESRNFSVQEIARLLGLQGFFLLVESGGSLTYETTESLFRLLLTSTLRPTYLEPIEQAFSWMLPAGRSARFITDEVLRADTSSRYTAYQAGLAAGFLTINEVRAYEGLEAIAGGDTPAATLTPVPDEIGVSP